MSHTRPLLFVAATIAGFLLLGLPARAGLVAQPASVDLGKQRQEKTVSSKLVLKNDGKGALEILRVAADCSCTAATPAKTTLQPGETTELDVSFETRTYQGVVHRRLMVQTSEGDLVIPVQAMVSPYDDWVLGAPLAILPPSNRGETVTATMDVTYTGEGEAAITALKPAVGWLEAEIAEHSGKTWKIKITKLAKAPGGNHQPRIAVTTTDAHEPEIGVGVFASVYSNLLIKPNPMLMPEGKVGQTVSMPFDISGWEAKEDPRFEIADGKVVQQQRDGRDVLLSLELTPTRPGTSTRLLRLFSGEDLEVEIPVIVRAE